MGLRGALAHRISSTQLQMIFVIRIRLEDEILDLVQVQRYGATTVLHVRRGAEGSTRTSTRQGPGSAGAGP